MKRLFRQIAGFSFGIPFILLVQCLSPFKGREEAVKLIGPYITNLAMQSLTYWIPKIQNASEFNMFPAKMKANLKYWSPLFDVVIQKETSDVFQVRIGNCPFCEAFFKMNMPELAPYVCQGDWEKAKRNRHKWDFERAHQIGTGDPFCDHTYKRIIC